MATDDIPPSSSQPKTNIARIQTAAFGSKTHSPVLVSQTHALMNLSSAYHSKMVTMTSWITPHTCQPVQATQDVTGGVVLARNSF